MEAEWALWATVMMWGQVVMLQARRNVEVTDCPGNHSDAALSMC